MDYLKTFNKTLSPPETNPDFQFMQMRVQQQNSLLIRDHNKDDNINAWRPLFQGAEKQKKQIQSAIDKLESQISDAKKDFKEHDEKLRKQMEKQQKGAGLQKHDEAESEYAHKRSDAF